MNIKSLLDEITPNLVVYLEKVLPALHTNDWWKELVFNTLTFQQQQRVKEKGIASLSSLDLAALLRVLEKNFHKIRTKMNLPQESFSYVKDMQSVRNRWMHLPSDGYSDKDIYRDLDTLERFAEVINADEQLLKAIQLTMQSALKKIVTDPPIDPLSEETESPIVRPTETPKTSGNDFIKINRIKLWAKRPYQANHKIIMAFLELEKTGDVFLRNFKSYCSNKNSKYQVEKFDGHYASMKTDAGNSHGKVFYDDENGIVAIYPRVREEIEKYFII